MTSYRFYLLNGQDRISGVQILEAMDDQSAARQAEIMHQELKPSGYEVWDLARRIARRPAKGQG